MDANPLLILELHSIFKEEEYKKRKFKDLIAFYASGYQMQCWMKIKFAIHLRDFLLALSLFATLHKFTRKKNVTDSLETNASHLMFHYKVVGPAFQQKKLHHHIEVAQLSEGREQDHTLELWSVAEW